MSPDSLEARIAALEIQVRRLAKDLRVSLDTPDTPDDDPSGDADR